MNSKSWIQFAAFGWVLLANLLLFVLGGHAIDKRWDTSPLFILIGLAVAITASTFSGVKLYKNIVRTQNKEKD
jgi:F0F1-type ATP synthase assembly protein I